MARKVELNHITKVEGHASLTLGLEGNTVTTCQLHAEEGSRYFEGLVVGRGYREASEITSRICGICSCGHTICSIQAIEAALGLEVSEQTKLLRELLTYGERIRSHVTHLYFLALPDYLDYESALAMAPEKKDELHRALQLIKLGNDIIFTLGGRDMHPASATVGGWLKTPTQQQLDALCARLESALNDARTTLELFASLEQPTFSRETEYIALRRDGVYATIEGDVMTTHDKIPKAHYKDYLSEYHEEYATSNFVVKEGKSYMVGAIARINHNHDQLLPETQAMLSRLHITPPLAGPFTNNLAQAIETLHVIERSIRILKGLRIGDEKPAEVVARAGVGIAAIEVPRGILWHEYELDEAGVIQRANIITPTCQNLRNCQDDIAAFVPSIAHLDHDSLKLEIEKLIRAYDPCFSCSTHFLRLKWV